MNKFITVPVIALLLFISSPYIHFNTINNTAHAAAPTITITSPIAGSNIAGTTVGLAVSASGTTLTSVQYKVDGNDIGGAIIAPYSYPWDSTVIANGAHTLTAVAFDAAGNSTTSAPIAFTLNNPTPVGGATYYIAASGLTTNTGTSSSSPWPLSKVASTAFNPGDHILFKKGDTFVGTTTFGRSGSAGNPIVLDAYGTGNNPVLDGAAGTGNNVLNVTGSYITIRDLVIQNGQNGSGLLHLNTGVHDITIYNCYINHGIRGIYAKLSGSNGVANIKILNNYFDTITDLTGFPYGGGNYVQFDTVTGSGVVIAYNQGYTVNVIGQSTMPYVGDLLNLYKSNGTAASPMLVFGNKLRGGGAEYYGKSALILGDVGGSYQYGYNNVFVNTGSVGAQAQGGTHINMSENKIYGATFPYSGLGLSWGNYSGVATTDIVMQLNRINWTDLNNNIANKFFHTLDGQPIGWTTNTADKVPDAGITDSMLSPTVWTGTPWNTGSTVTPPPTDTTAPTVSMTAPAGGTTVSGTSVTLTASASDNVGVASVQFVLDGQLTGTLITTAPYSYTLNTTALANGTHTISAVAKDAAGNTGTSAVVNVTVSNVITDTTAPTVSITAPIANATVSGSTVSLAASASDNVGIANVQFKLDGTLVGTPITAAPYTYTWNTTTATNASHTISAVAKDAAGNSTTSAVVNVTVSNTVVVNTAPVISAVAISSITQTSANLAFTTDQATTNTIAYGTTTSYSTGSILSGSYLTAHSIYISPLASGTLYHYHIVSTNQSGLVTTSPDFTFTTLAAADTTAPTVSIAAPASGATVSGSAIALTASASDNVGVANVQFMIDGTLVGTPITAAPYTYTWNTTTATNASHTISAVAKDAAGNAATSASTTVTVDNAAPVISAVTNTVPTQTGVTITWTTDKASSSQVDYGTTTSYGTSSTFNSAQTTSHSVVLSALSAGTTYHYHVKSIAANNMLSTSADFTFTTPAALDTTAPTVSITAPIANATVSGSTVSLAASASDNIGVTNVQIKIDGVNVGTALTVAPYTYTWNTTSLVNGTHTISATAADAAGNIGTAAIVSVTVNNVVNTAPVISAVVISSTTSTSANLTFTTDQATSNVIAYGTTTSYSTGSVLSGSYLITHTIYMSPLASGTLYHYHIVSTAQNGLVTTSPDFTFMTTGTAPDTTAPTVSITAPIANATVSGSTVSLAASASDNVGIANVQFKLDGTLVGTPITAAPYTYTWNTTTATNASHTISAVAKDAAGNSTTSAVVNVTVSNTVVVNTAPVISNLSSGAPSTYTATITWTTDQPADSQVEYGTTTGYGSLTTLNTSLVTSHSVTLTGLMASTTYHYGVESTANGLQTIATDFTFTTTKLFRHGKNATLVTAFTAGMFKSTVRMSNFLAVNTPDTTAPTVTITAPANSASVSGIVSLAASASDNVGAASIQFTINDVVVAETATAPYVYNWNSTSVPNGVYAINAIAYDAADNSTTSSTVTVIVANPAPVLFGQSSGVTTTVTSGGGGGGGSSTVIPVATGGGSGSGTSSVPTTAIPSGCTALTAFSPFTGQSCPNHNATATAAVSGALTKALKLGSRDNEILLLQHFLNTHGFPIAPSGTGSLNHETTYFGLATKAALKKFQASKGITATGTVGPLTRNAINAMNQ